MPNKLCIICQTPLYGQKQKFCSNACKQKDHYYRVKNQTNTYFSQTLRSLKRKLQLIELLGGQCSKCGYADNIAALHFHHHSTEPKEFKLDLRILSNKRWNVILKEASKCTLLCSNCHAEIHNPELFIHNVQKILRNASNKNVPEKPATEFQSQSTAIIEQESS